jgi:cell division transport system permease protein
MIRPPFTSASPEARLLPAERLHGPTTAVMAIMTFVMMIVATAGLALVHSASAITATTANRYVIEIPAAAASELPKAVAAARSLPQVERVSEIPQSEMRRALERWLGEAASSADLPVPAMATVDLARGANADAVAEAVRKQVPEARLGAESTELKPLIGSLRALQWLALFLVLLMAGATAAGIVLAARGALDTHRPTVGIMHGIGATDAQITRLFERKIAMDSIAGALLGAIGAGTILLLLGAGNAAAGDLGSAPLGLKEALVLALMPVAAVVIAVVVARLTLLRALRATL